MRVSQGWVFPTAPGRCQGTADVSQGRQGRPGEDPRRFPGHADISRTSQDVPGTAESVPVAESPLTLTPATGVGRATEIRQTAVSRSILSASKTASVPLAWAMRFDAVSLTASGVRRSGLRPPASGLRPPAPASGVRHPPRPAPPPQERPQNAPYAPRRASGGL